MLYVYVGFLSRKFRFYGVFIYLFLFSQSKLHLVGNVAPDFEAEAVFDQEFITVLILIYFDFFFVAYYIVGCLSLVADS